MSTSAVSREISRSSLSVVAALQERYYAPRAMGTMPDTYTLPLYFLTPRSSIHISQNVSLKFRFSFLLPPPVPIWVQVIWIFNKCSELSRCRWLASTTCGHCKLEFWEGRGAQLPNPTKVWGLGGGVRSDQRGPQYRRGKA